MVAFGIGPYPGSNVAEAADIILSETGGLPHLPQFPDRGLGSDLVGRTAAVLSDVPLDRGPRSWRITDRPQLITHQLRDQLERDLDAVQEVWGEDLERVKVQVVGPWTMAAALELPNGHRVLTDYGAVRDVHGELQVGIAKHCQDVARRFNAEVILQLDEPMLADALRGLPGTTDFDPVRPVPAEVALDTLERFEPDYLHLGTPLWEISVGTPLLEFAGLDTPEHLDGLGQWLDAGNRVGLGLHRKASAREAAIELARHMDRLGLQKELLATAVDVYPVEVEGAKDYAYVAEVAEILGRDAGDL
ncbi:methionine synthase [Corynebacterium camporealensis]